MAKSRHDSHRRGDNQCSGTRDHQECQAQANVARDQQQQARAGDDQWRVVARERVQQPLDLGPLLLSLRHQVDKPAEGGVGADALGLDLELAAAADAAAQHQLTRSRLDRQGFARQSRCIQDSLPGQHLAVNGDAVSRKDDHGLTGLHLIRRHDQQLARAQHPGGSRRHVDEAAQRRPGSRQGQALQVTAQHIQPGHRRRLPVLADPEGPRGGDGHQQGDAELTRRRPAPGLAGHRPPGNQRGGGHQDRERPWRPTTRPVVRWLARAQPTDRPGHGDQQAGARHSQQLTVCPRPGECGPGGGPGRLEPVHHRTPGPLVRAGITAATSTPACTTAPLIAASVS